MVNVKILTIAIVAVMAMSGVTVMAMSSEDTEAAQINATLGSTSYVHLTPGDEFRVYAGKYNAELLIMGANSVSWMDLLPISDGPLNGKYVKGTAQIGRYTFNPGSGLLIQIDVCYDITYHYQNYDYTEHCFDQYPKLQSTSEVQTGKTLAWYDASGKLFGYAGETKQISSSMHLYARWDQTSVIIKPTEDHVKVHYRDIMEYTLVTEPPTGCVITPKWIGVNPLDLKINATGNRVWVDVMEADSGIVFEMQLEITYPGLKTTYFVLKVHVYPREIEPMQTYGLSYWQHTFPTGSTTDSLKVISATRTLEGQTYTINPSLIHCASPERMVSYTFTEPGVHEFTVKISSLTGINITSILRINVTSELETGTPLCDGIEVVADPNGRDYDFILKNPQNFVSVQWIFDDGTVLKNHETRLHHTYLIPGAYRVTATLINSLGEEVTVITDIDAFFLQKPGIAYIKTQYSALIEVDSMSGITVDCPDWMDWELFTRESKNYLLVTGMTTNTDIVGNSYPIIIYMAGVEVDSWDVACHSPWSIVRAAFDIEIDGTTVKIRYTGTRADGDEYISVQWSAGQGYQKYMPTVGGWASSTYTEGTYLISVSAIVGGIESTSSKVIHIGPVSSGVPGGPDVPDDPEEGIFDIIIEHKELVTIVAIIIVVLAAIAIIRRDSK